MTSIYKKLLKYQSTKDRSNLENYSTEILCDFLNRLSEKDSFKFIRDVIFLEKRSSNFEKFILKHKNLKGNYEIVWQTQYSIVISETIKYPDLVGFINNKPAIIIEVKINAGFTSRTHEDKEGNIIQISQLVDYGNWLNNSNEYGVLVLLSHLTPPPFDFLAEGKKYGVAERSYITWGRIFHWLNKLQGCFLSNDFKEYLLESNMAIESPKREDFSIIEMIISGSGKKIGDMMTFIRTELEKKNHKNMSWGKEKNILNSELYAVEYDQKMLWSWVILDTSEYSFIAWGICFPDGSDAWSWSKLISDLPTEPFVFIGLFSEGECVIDKYNKYLKVLPETWNSSNNLTDIDSDLLSIRFMPLHKFTSFKEDTTEKVFEFIDTGFQEVAKLVNKLAS